MAISGFQHLNIRCAESDLPAVEKFYGEVLDLKAGPRPAFPFAGIWLYDGNDPIIHVGGRFPKGSIVQDTHNGSVDHIAFRAAGAVEFRARLKILGVYFEEQNIPKAGYQVFFARPGRHQARVQLSCHRDAARTAERHERGDAIGFFIERPCGWRSVACGDSRCCSGTN